MNTNTGKIYEGEKEITAARDRGENLVPVLDRVAILMREAREARLEKIIANRRKRRQGHSKKMEAKRKPRNDMARESRKRNR